MADNPGTGGGKIRPRRAATQRKPYSRAPSQRKSLFSRVTDSVKSFLNPIAPRWLTNRLNSDEEQQLEQQTQNLGNDEPSTSSNHQRPHSTNNNYKRSQLTRPPMQQSTKVSASSLQYYVTPPDTPPQETVPKVLVGDTETGKEGLLKHLSMASKRAKMEIDDSPQLPSDSSYLRQELKLLSTNDNASVASSSGCSSSVQVGSQRNSDNEQKPIWSSSMESLTSSRASSLQQQATMSSHKRPRFNPALFGMPALGVNRTGDSFHSSFYEGPVQFGGANASGRSPHFATPYKIPTVTKVKVRHVNHQRTPARSSITSSRSSKSPMNESSAVGMSSTAKKILQTLEQMSSPLNDARKIPTMARTPSSFAADRIKRRSVAGTSMLGNSLHPPPIGGLSSPSAARLRRRSHMPINNSLLIDRSQSKPTPKPKVKPVKKAVTISEEAGPSRPPVPDSKDISIRGLPAPIASMSSSENLLKQQPYSAYGGETSTGGGGKMKTQKRNTSHYSATQDEAEEEEAPDLPNVALPVSSLPLFNFGKSMMTSTPTVKPSEKRGTVKQPEFNFASPLTKATNVEQAKSSADTPKYQFSSPSAKGSGVDTDHATPKARPQSNFAVGSKPTKSPLLFAPDPKVVSAVKASKRITSPLATASSTSESAGPGLRAAETLKPGSVLDILGGTSSSSKSTESVPATITTPASLPPLKQIISGWTCEVCMVPNKTDADSCVACTTPKPGAAAKKPSLSSIFTQKKGWDCGVCMVRNDSDKDKCIACEEPRPESGNKPPAVPKDGGFKPTVFGASKSNFSFGIPPKKDTETKKDAPGNTFGDQFKKPKGTWECGACLVPNDASRSDCVACQTPKPGASKTITSSNSSASHGIKFGITSSSSQGFGEKKTSGWGDLAKKQTATWECEICMVPNSEERRTCVACEGPKPGTKNEMNTSFKFGESSSGLFKFGKQGKTAEDVASAQKSENTQPATSTQQTTETKTTTEVAPSAPSLTFGSLASKSQTSVTPTFGTVSKKPEAAAPTISFGQKTEETGEKEKTDDNKQSTPQATFTFGAQKKDETPSTGGSTGFKLTKEVTNPPAYNTAAFQFGSKTQSFGDTAKKANAPEKNTNPTAAPVFGAHASAPPPPYTDARPAPTSQPAATFPFGNKQETKGFGNPAPKVEEQKATFNFGQTSTITAGATKTEENKPAFSFGQANSNTAAVFPFSGSAGSSLSKEQPASTVSMGFGATNSAKPAEGKNPSNLFGMSSGVPPSGFGATSNTPKPAEKKTEVAKPLFGGFGQSQTGGAFGKSAPPNASPFGGGSSTAFSANSNVPSGPLPASGSIFSSGNSGNSAFGGSTSTPSTGQNQQSSGGIFGNNSTTAFGGQTSELPKPSFNFGAAGASSNTSQGGVFKFGASNPQTGGFAFGSNSNPAQPSAGLNFGSTPNKQPFNPTPAAGGFQFGAGSTPAQSNGVFQFGAGGNDNNQAQAPGVQNSPFQFSGSNTTNSSGSAGFNFSAGPTMNFGGQPETPQGGGMFSVGAGGNSTGRSTTPVNARKKIQARRRNKR